ncbi:M20/M25/M40 family metallo-hydrolase [Humibacter soli]
MDATAQAVALLRELIRNACVNDGSPDSGHEERSARTLEGYFAASGIDVELVEPHPGRVSLIVRIPGTDPAAPTLALVGHTDVVPVVADAWVHDPFAAVLDDDGVIWGRGALDMLAITVAYAIVAREVAEEPLPGGLVFAAVADEEGGGRLGTDWILKHRPELLRADAAITESGGVPLRSLDVSTGDLGPVGGVTVTVAEKGISTRRLKVRGLPAHGSTPYGSVNAAVLAARAIERIAAHPSPAVIDEFWPRYVDAAGFPPSVAARLVDPETLDSALPELGPLAGLAHALTHTTVSPTIVRGGDARNVIPGAAEVVLDVRTLPGVTPRDVDALIVDALGDLAPYVTVTSEGDAPSSSSATGTPLFEAIRASIADVYPHADAVPVVAPGGSDGRFLRWAGIPTYGFDVLSERWTHAAVRRGMHGNDEHIDVASIRASITALRGVVRRYLGTPREAGVGASARGSTESAPGRNV